MDDWSSSLRGHGADVSDPPFMLPADLDVAVGQCHGGAMDHLQFVMSRSILRETQSGLAKRLGVSRRQIIRYEKGHSPVPQPVIRLVKTFLSDKQKDD